VRAVHVNFKQLSKLTTDANCCCCGLFCVAKICSALTVCLWILGPGFWVLVPGPCIPESWLLSPASAAPLYWLGALGTGIQIGMVYCSTLL